MNAGPFGGRLGVESIRGCCEQTPQQIDFPPPPKLMIPLWGSLMFNLDGLVV